MIFLGWFIILNSSKKATDEEYHYYRYVESGEGGKFSILSGMKIKASKEPKYAAQTETNLNFS